MEQRYDSHLLARLIFLMSGRRDYERNIDNFLRRAVVARELRSVRSHWTELLPGVDFTSQQPFPKGHVAQQRALFKKLSQHLSDALDVWEQLGPAGRRELDHAVKWEIMAMRSGQRDQQDHLFQIPADQLVDMMDYQNAAIAMLLNPSDPKDRSHQKSPLRRNLLEPFFYVLELFELWEPGQPFSEVVEALFDWVGLEQKYRPTASGIRTAVREFRQEFEGEHPDPDERHARKAAIVERAFDAMKNVPPDDLESVGVTEHRKYKTLTLDTPDGAIRILKPYD
jgi:hypothetical protein